MAEGININTMTSIDSQNAETGEGSSGVNFFLLNEDGHEILNEDNTKILLEESY